MNTNPRDEGLPTKQEGAISNDKYPTSSRLWSGSQNPRIVRVSKLFGGKDRHSKVSTVRGLRDRRVRLSVPTAIQLYDLQDRLGLSQPSKVVDWLLNASQHEIDKLPPLEMPQENYIQSPQLSISFRGTQSQASSHPSPFESSDYLCGNGDSLLSLSSMKANKEIYNNAPAVGDVGTLLKSTHWNLDASQRRKPREEMREASIGKESIVEGDEVEIQGVGIHGVQVFSHGSAPRMSDSSLSSLLNNSVAYASYYHLDPSNAYAADSERNSSEAQGANIYSSSLMSSLMPGSQLLYSSSSAVPSIVPSYATASADLSRKKFDHFHTVSSVSQNLSLNSLRDPQFGSPTMSFFQSNFSPKQHHSQNQHGK